MAGILGSLIVELRANVADFVTGMSGASYAAKKAGSDIEGAFSDVGDVAATLLAPLGEVGEQISETFSRVGEWGAAASRELSKFSGSFGVVGVGAGLAAGALAAVDAAAIGLTLHTAAAAAKLYELSQSTGVSVEALSGFKFVAEQNGVAAETMSLALERMGKSAFLAATAPVGSILAQGNAYARLGISLRDASGNLRSSQDLFEAVAAKFEKMPDGIAKSALAMEIFGRGGAALIPVLNQGRDGIDELLAEAQKLGVVMSTATASAAEAFEGKLNLIKAGAEGAANKLTEDLLPAFTNLVTLLTTKSSASGDETRLQHDADNIAILVRATIAAGEITTRTLEEIGFAFETVGEAIIHSALAIKDFAVAADKWGHFDFSGAKASAQAGLHDLTSVFTDFWGQQKDIFNRSKEFLNELYAPRAPYTLPQGGNAAPDSTPANVQRSNAIADMIAKLQAQAEAEGQLANSISSVTANTILATAAAEAQKDISELQIRAAAQGKSVSAAEAQSIRELVTLTAAYKAAYGDNKQLEDFIQKTDLQAKSLEALANAYGEGAAAVERAQEAEKIAPFEKQASDIAGVIDQLKKLGTAGDLTESIAKSIAGLKQLGATEQQIAPLKAALFNVITGGDPLAPLEHAYAQLQDKIATAIRAVHEFAAAEEARNLATELSQLAREASEQEKYTIALLAGSAALRQLKIDQQVTAFAQKNPLLSGDEISAYRSQLEQLTSVQQVNAAAERVASSQAFLDTETQIAALEQLRQTEIARGVSTLATDTLIHSEQIKAIEEHDAYVAESQNAELLGNAKLFESQQQLISQWDQAALKVGTFADQFRAFLNEMSQQGQNLGVSLAGSMTKFVDGFEDQLAKLVVTGKANFLQLYQSFEESLLKSTIQKGTSLLTGSLEKTIFGGAIPGGGGGKRGDSPGNPLYVAFGTGGGAAAGLFGSGGGTASPGTPAPGIFGILEKLFHAPGGTAPTLPENGGALPIDTNAFGGPGGGPSAFAGIPGLGGSNATGTEASPFYVIPTDESGNILGESGFGGGSSGGGFLSMFGSGGSDSDSGSGGGGGGFLGLLSGLFSSGGGTASGAGAGADMSGVDAADFIGMADGGDVTPGSAYLVGEEHPEIFAPRTAGRIIPDFSKAMRSRPQGTTINFHVHGVQDVNSFNKSRGQIMASMHREMEAQRKRNG